MDQRIQSVILAIEKDLADPLSPNELARAVNLSSSRLRHLFRTVKNMTLAQYQGNARMEEARRLLSTTYLSVKEVMTQVGIHSDSHFARDFKEACGLSPTQYRARTQAPPSI